MNKLPFNTIRDEEPAPTKALAPYDKKVHNYRIVVFREGIKHGQLEYTAEEWKGVEVTGVTASTEAVAARQAKQLAGERAFIITRG